MADACYRAQNYAPVDYGFRVAEQVPPSQYSLEAEQSVIGGLMLNPGAMESVSKCLPKHFFNHSHREIMRVLRSLHDDNQVIDLVTVSESLKDSDQLDMVGGIPYLSDIARNTPSAANVESYAKIVTERWIQREAAKLTSKAVSSIVGADVEKAASELIQVTEFIEAEKAKIHGVESDLVWDWEDEPVEAPMLIDGLIPEGGFGVFYGKEKSKKTWTVIDAASRIALGQKWHGHDVKRGRVIYIIAEGGEENFKNRLRAVEQKLGSLKGRLLPVFRPTFGDEPADIARLSREIEGVNKKATNQEDKVVMVVWDTVSRTMKGNEKEGIDMKAYIAGMDRLRDRHGVTCVCVHHQPKNTDGGVSMRGASELPGAVDFGWHVSSGEGLPAKITGAGLCRNFEPEDREIHFESVVIGQGKDGKDITALVADHDAPLRFARNATEKADKRTQVDIAVELLIELYDPASDGVSWDEWRPAMIAAGIAPDATSVLKGRAVRSCRVFEQGEKKEKRFFPKQHS